MTVDLSFHFELFSTIMEKTFSTVSLLIVSLFFISLSGCGGTVRPDGMPPLHPATITVTQDGAPLSEATVMLLPQSPEMQRWSCGGITDSSGNVTLSTLGNQPGVVAGKFTVTIAKTDADPPIPFEGEMTKAQQEADAKRKVYDLVDPKYASPKTSGLEIDVTSGKNAKTFDVGKAVRVARP